MSYRTRLTGLVLGLATTGALVAAGLAGCGGGGKTDAGATPGTTGSSASARGGSEIQAYVSCLNQHGVKVAMPSGGPGGFRSGRPTDRPSRAAGFPSGRPTAFPSGGFGGGRGGFGGIFGAGGQAPAGVDQATWQAAQQACASVRPSFAPGSGQRADNGAYAAYLNCLRSHGVSASAGPGRFNTADPTVASAMKTCEPLRPSGGPAPAPSATS